MIQSHRLESISENGVMSCMRAPKMYKERFSKDSKIGGINRRAAD